VDGAMKRRRPPGHIRRRQLGTPRRSPTNVQVRVAGDAGETLAFGRGQLWLGPGYHSVMMLEQPYRSRPTVRLEVTVQ
jgi:hypothetical protein